QGGGVEVGLGTRHPVEVVEEGPGIHVSVGEQAGEDDPGIRIHALDRVVCDPKQCRVPPGGGRGRVVPLQIGLVPDLPELDRQRRGVRSKRLFVLPPGGPVSTAGPIARHRSLEEVSPRLFVGDAVKRGPRDVAAADPARRPPHERHGSDSLRSKAANEPVPAAPVVGARGFLYFPPLEHEAGGLDPGVRHPLAVLRIKLTLGDAEELRPDRRAGRGRGEQGQRERSDDAREKRHSRHPALHPGYTHRHASRPARRTKPMARRSGRWRATYPARPGGNKQLRSSGKGTPRFDVAVKQRLGQPPRYRASANSPLPAPTATILPSPWSATPFAMSKAPKLVRFLPSAEKLVSSEPLGS